ncbi:MAG: hypothetical protein IJ574_04310 [Bacilli bacterium]|nr:hypothetical protein [Bacilli bacterium]
MNNSNEIRNDIEMITNYIKEAQMNNSDDDLEFLKNIVKENIKQINNLMINACEDERTYVKAIVQSKLASIIFRSKGLSDYLISKYEKGIKKAEYERTTLLELKKYLKAIQQTAMYENLDLVFEMIYTVLNVQNMRRNNIKTEASMTVDSLRKINYIPATDNENIDEYIEFINNGLDTINKKQSR